MKVKVRLHIDDLLDYFLKHGIKSDIKVYPPETLKGGYIKIEAELVDEIEPLTCKGCIFSKTRPDQECIPCSRGNHFDHYRACPHDQMCQKIVELGNCYHEFTCRDCGRVKREDSSD